MSIMGKIKVKISDETEKIFRYLAEKEFGTGKANLDLAAEDAMVKWLQERKERVS